MKKVYLYPLTARTKGVVVNPYMENLRDALNENFQVVNAKKPSTIGIFDIFRYLGKVHVVYFNWSEELPSLHRGKLQGIFLLVLLQFLKLSHVIIVWTRHNKKSHFDQHSRLKNLLYGQMLKKSDLIITHARDGLNHIPKGKKACFLHHPVSKYIKTETLSREKQYDIIIWGTIAPYKGITSFLDFLEKNGTIRNYRILLAGKIVSQSLAKQLQAFESKYSNLVLMDTYVETKNLIDLIHDSKITLFTYQSDSVLSSGALIDSLSYGASIVGPAVGAFNDLQELELIETYVDFQSLTEVIDRLLTSSEENQARQKRLSQFMTANTWTEFSRSVLNLIEQ